MSEPAFAAVPEPSPRFKFLAYFEEKDKDLFAGRDREVNEVLAGILRARTLVLYGRSGLGKTSLLLAGVFPELPKRGLTPVYMRLFDRPLVDLRAALKKSFPDLDITAETSLVEILRAIPAKRGIVLVLDQLEEIFIHFRERPDVRWTFIEAIAEIVRDTTLEVRIVFSLREDYLAELDDFRARLPELFANEYRLHSLTAFGARQAISRALQHAGLSYEQRLLTGLVDALEEYRYDPAILQILCSELYREMVLRGESSTALKAADLERLGGLEGIFRSYLENLDQALQPDQRLLAMVVLDSLVTREHTKRAVTIESLLDGYFIVRLEEMTEILKLLVAYRVVRPVERGTVRFELIHDRLVEPIQYRLKLDSEFFEVSAVRDLVTNAALIGAFRRQPELLLTTGQIQIIRAYQSRLRFTESQLELLLRSAVYRQPSDVQYWAERFGLDTSIEIVLEMLGSTDWEVRSRAADAAAHLSDPSGLLAKRCLELALDDGEEAVRHTASHSTLVLRHPEHESVLIEGLRSRRTRNAAIYNLSDLVAAGIRFRKIDLHWQLRAEFVARKKFRHDFRDDLRRIASFGTFKATVVGFVSGIWLSPILLWFFDITPYTGDNFVKNIWPFVLAVPSVGLSGLFGWPIARSYARVKLRREHISWFRIVLQSGHHLAIISVMLAPVWSFAILRRGFTGAFSSMLFLFIVTFLHVLTAAQTLLAQRCIKIRSQPAAVWGWIVLLAFGFPLFIPLAFVLLASPLQTGGILAFGLFWHFDFFISTAVLAFSEGKFSSSPSLPEGTQRWPRVVAVVACAATAMAVLLFAWGSIS